MYIFFFFQAEDGIRDVAVTGVQTCALPISPQAVEGGLHPAQALADELGARRIRKTNVGVGAEVDARNDGNPGVLEEELGEVGRASQGTGRATDRRRLHEELADGVERINRSRGQAAT